MSPHLPEFERKNYLTVLLMLVIAGSAFVLGTNFKESSPSSITTPANSNSNPTEQSVVGGIAQTLASPATSTEATAADTTQSEIGGLININTATAAELDKLPGIGPTYAQAIITYRSQNGPFVKIEDIEKVKGIGPKTFEKLKDKITV